MCACRDELCWQRIHRRRVWVAMSGPLVRYADPYCLPDAKNGFTDAEAQHRVNKSGNRKDILIPEQDLLQGWAGLVQYSAKTLRLAACAWRTMAFGSPFLTNPSEHRGTSSGVSSPSLAMTITAVVLGHADLPAEACKTRTPANLTCASWRKSNNVYHIENIQF